MWLDFDKAMSLFLDLEEYTVSLDRIMSRINGGADPEILLNYVLDRMVASRMSHARTFVGDVIAVHIGEEALEEAAEGAYKYSD